MEIVTYVLEGAIAHRDSLGTGSQLQAGELQRITAGSGITHSEYNPSTTEPLHLYQIWLFPERRGLTPSYEQRRIEPGHGWRLAASPNGEGDSLTIHQDARIYLAEIQAGDSLTKEFAEGRAGWLQVLRGEVTVNDLTVSTGDGLAIDGEPRIHLTGIGGQPAEIMLFDLN